MTMKDLIYLDYQATTPCDKEVLDAMLPYFSEKFGNAHSRSHTFGWQAEEAVEEARKAVADIIGAGTKEIVFTSGATEANNIAIKGVAHFHKDKKKHIVTCITEHKCVLEACRYLEQEGNEVTYLAINKDGLIDLELFKSSLREDTVLVTIMAANHEIGVLQPIKEIGQICRDKGIYFHVDAAQAIGKIAINVDYMNIDLLSLSGHKIYGPKGIGALYVRRKPRVRIKSIISGGGQERAIRSGTLPVPLCVGLGKACAIAKEKMPSEAKRLKGFRDKFLSLINSALDQVYVNGSLEHRLPGNLNISFAHVEGESLMMGVQNLAVSSGSACTSASLEPSYVLAATGISDELAHTSLRISFGRYTTDEDVETAAKDIIATVKKLRDMSPLYEMEQQGIDISAINWSTH